MAKIAGLVSLSVTSPHVRPMHAIPEVLDVIHN